MMAFNDFKLRPFLFAGKSSPVVGRNELSVGRDGRGPSCRSTRNLGRHTGRKGMGYRGCRAYETGLAPVKFTEIDYSSQFHQHFLLIFSYESTFLTRKSSQYVTFVPKTRAKNVDEIDHRFQSVHLVTCGVSTIGKRFGTGRVLVWKPHLATHGKACLEA
jgi:hypothetical protein